MIGPAANMKISVRVPSTATIRLNRPHATVSASFRRPFSSSSVNTGTNAAWSAASANSARIRFGTWNATVKADIGPVTPNLLAATISRISPATRDSPVAAEKKTALMASRRLRAAGASGAPGGGPASQAGVASPASGAAGVRLRERASRPRPPAATVRGGSDGGSPSRGGGSPARGGRSPVRGGASRLRDGASRLGGRVPRLRGGRSPSRDVTSRPTPTSRRFLMPAPGRYSRPPPRREVAAIVCHGQHRLTREAHPPGGAGAAREPTLHLVDQ